jgi:hypothetical protein
MVILIAAVTTPRTEVRGFSVHLACYCQTIPDGPAQA